MPEYLAHMSAEEWGSLTVDALPALLSGGALVGRTVARLTIRLADSAIEVLEKVTIRFLRAGASAGGTFNLDAGAITNLAAKSPFNATVRQMWRDIGNADLVATRTALGESLGQVKAWGSSIQRKRWIRNYDLITKIPESPTTRFQIPSSQRLGANDLLIFGTGDYLGITTLTTDRRFVTTFQNRFNTILDVIIYTTLRL